MMEQIILNVFLVVIPAAAVVVTVWFFLRQQLTKDSRNLQYELKKDRQSFFLPLRVEAYQRAALLMERIHPGSLVMRLHTPGEPAKKFQGDILAAIRSEYDHNVAQQLYISPQVWQMLKNSKEETIKIINIAGNQMSAASTSTDLAGKIFEIVAEVGTLPTEISIEALKKELQDLF